MTNKNTVRAAAQVLPALLICLGATGAMAQDSERKITVEELPAAVKATAEQNAQGGTIIEVEEETQVTYSVEVRKTGGETVEFEIAANGKLLETETEADDDAEDDDGAEDGEENETAGNLDKGEKYENPVPAGSVPAAVKQALETKHAGATIDEAEVVHFFELDITVSGQERELRVSENGEILDDKTDDAADNAMPDEPADDQLDLAERFEQTISSAAVPAEVKQTVETKHSGAQITEAEEVHFYELDATANGQKRELRISADGQILNDKADDAADQPM